MTIDCHRQIVKVDALMVSAFQSVRIGEVAHLLQYHSATTFLRHALIPILRTHLFHREVAALILKVHTVEGEHFSKQLGLHLLVEVLKGIPVEEVPFFACMGMQIDIKEQPALILQYLFSAERYSARDFTANTADCL